MIIYYIYIFCDWCQLAFIPPKVPSVYGMFPCFLSGLHFLPKSRCCTWPRSWCTSEWCESSDSSRRCWPATGDRERLEDFLSGIRLGSRWGWCVSVKRIGNWWGKKEETCSFWNSWVCNSHVKTHSFGTTVWWRIPGLLGGTLWSEDDEDGGWKG